MQWKRRLINLTYSLIRSPVDRQTLRPRQQFCFSPYCIHTVNFKPYCFFFFAFIPHIRDWLPIFFSFAFPYSRKHIFIHTECPFLPRTTSIHFFFGLYSVPLSRSTLILLLSSRIFRHDFFSQRYVQTASTSILSHFSAKYVTRKLSTYTSAFVFNSIQPNHSTDPSSHFQNLYLYLTFRTFNRCDTFTKLPFHFLLSLNIPVASGHIQSY